MRVTPGPRSARSWIALIASSIAGVSDLPLNGLAGLFSRHAGQLPTTLTPALEARILEWSVKRKPHDGSTHWSTRKLAAQLNVSHMMVARVWRKHALRPHRLEG